MQFRCVWLFLMTVLNRGEQQSRKSTQRRQKQYFEQKKRRQQLQAAGLNNFGDGMDRYGQRQKEHHRSLDILSFLNFSTTAQQHGSGIDHLKAIDSKIETQTAHDLSIATMDANTHLCPMELKRAGPALAHNVEAASSEKFINKVCLKAPADPGRRPVEEMYRWEIFPEANMSILDFLGDDGTDQSPEVKPVNEDHVAFSVDGLGRVGTETPIDSSKHRSRTFSYGAFSSSKGPRDLDLFVDHINALYEYDPRCKADSSIPDVNAACSLSPGSFSFSQHIWDPFSIPEQEASRFFDSFNHNLDDNRRKLSSGFWKSCHSTDNSNKDIWNDQDAVASPSPHVSSVDGLLYGKSYKVSSMDCPFRRDGRSGDYTSARCRNQGSIDHASDSVYLRKKRDNFKAKDDLSVPGLRKPGNKYAGATQPSAIMPESGDHEGVSIPIKSKRSLDSTMHLKKLFSQSDWFLERPLRVDSEFCSIHGATKKKTALTGCGPWKAESISAYPEPDFCVEDQLPFDEHTHYPDPVRCPHSSSFMSANFASDKTFRQFSFHGFRGLPKDGFEPTFNSLYNEIKYMASNLSHVAGLCRDMSAKERLCGDVQNESNLQL